MKKKQILVLGASLLLGLVVSIGLSYAGSVWTDPSSQVPAGNKLIPINTSAYNQVKQGDLTVGTSFNAKGDASFDQNVGFMGSITGGVAGAPAPLTIGGVAVDPNLQDPIDYRVNTEVNGYVQATKMLASDELASDQRHYLCGDDQGHVVFCPDYGPIHNLAVSASYNETLSASSSGFTPLNAPMNKTVYGNHTAFTGPITVTASAQTGPSSHQGSAISLEVNNVGTSCHYLPDPPFNVTFSFPSASYTTTDNITIASITGGQNCW